MWEGRVEPQEPERVGAVLQQSRLRAGFDLAEVSQCLHIRRGYLEAIEQGHFDALPGPAYATGFVRAYAGLLGLDAGALVERMRREAGSVSTSALHFPEPVADGNAPRAGVLLIGAAIALLAYGGWYMTSLHAPDAGSLATERADRAAPSDRTVALHSAEPEMAFAPSGGGAPPVAAIAEERPDDAARVVPEAARSATTALAAEPPSRLVLRARP